MISFDEFINESKGMVIDFGASRGGSSSKQVSGLGTSVGSGAGGDDIVFKPTAQKPVKPEKGNIGYGFKLPIAVFNGVVASLKKSNVLFDEDDPRSITQALNVLRQNERTELVKDVAKESGTEVDFETLLSDFQDVLDSYDTATREFSKYAEAQAEVINTNREKLLGDIWNSDKYTADQANDAVSKWSADRMNTQAGTRPGGERSGDLPYPGYDGRPPKPGQDLVTPIPFQPAPAAYMPPVEKEPQIYEPGIPVPFHTAPAAYMGPPPAQRSGDGDQPISQRGYPATPHPDQTKGKGEGGGYGLYVDPHLYDPDSIFPDILDHPIVPNYTPSDPDPDVKPYYGPGDPSRVRPYGPGPRPFPDPPEPEIPVTPDFPLSQPDPNRPYIFPADDPRGLPGYPFPKPPEGYDPFQKRGGEGDQMQVPNRRMQVPNRRAALMQVPNQRFGSGEPTVQQDTRLNVDVAPIRGNIGNELDKPGKGNDFSNKARNRELRTFAGRDDASFLYGKNRKTLNQFMSGGGQQARSTVDGTVGDAFASETPPFRFPPVPPPGNPNLDPFNPINDPKPYQPVPNNPTHPIPDMPNINPRPGVGPGNKPLPLFPKPDPTNPLSPREPGIKPYRRPTVPMRPGYPTGVPFIVTVGGVALVIICIAGACHVIRRHQEQPGTPGVPNPLDPSPSPTGSEPQRNPSRGPTRYQDIDA